MPKRSFPFSPRTAVQLEPGDLIAVPVDGGRWTCLQVTDLQPRGRKYLVVGVLPWAGDEPPTAGDVAGLAAIDQGLTNIQIFTEGGLEVVGSSDVLPSGLASSFQAEAPVGTSVKVWGWQAAIRKAAAAAGERS